MEVARDTGALGAAIKKSPDSTRAFYMEQRCPCMAPPTRIELITNP